MSGKFDPDSLERIRDVFAAYKILSKDSNADLCFVIRHLDQVFSDESAMDVRENKDLELIHNGFKAYKMLIKWDPEAASKLLVERLEHALVLGDPSTSHQSSKVVPVKETIASGDDAVMIKEKSAEMIPTMATTADLIYASPSRPFIFAGASDVSSLIQDQEQTIKSASQAVGLNSGDIKPADDQSNSSNSLEKLGLKNEFKTDSTTYINQWLKESIKQENLFKTSSSGAVSSNNESSDNPKEEVLKVDVEGYARGAEQTDTATFQQSLDHVRNEGNMFGPRVVMKEKTAKVTSTMTTISTSSSLMSFTYAEYKRQFEKPTRDNSSSGLNQRKTLKSTLPDEPIWVLISKGQSRRTTRPVKWVRKSSASLQKFAVQKVAKTDSSAYLRRRLNKLIKLAKANANISNFFQRGSTRLNSKTSDTSNEVADASDMKRDARDLVIQGSSLLSMVGSHNNYERNLIKGLKRKHKITKDIKIIIEKIPEDNSLNGMGGRMELLLHRPTPDHPHGKSVDRNSNKRQTNTSSSSMESRNGVYNCSHCKKGYSSQAWLDRHIASCTRQKSFVCKYCKSKFKLKSSLTWHTKIHIGENRYKCTFCQKSFTRPSQVTIHERIHTGEKPYKCRYCRKSFTQSGTVKIHERIHNGEKPYECKHCQKKFANKGSLNYHERTLACRKGLPITSKS